MEAEAILADPHDGRTRASDRYLGEITSALIEAGLIAADNPAAARLAALCQRLGVPGPGPAIAAAVRLPVRWASVIAQRPAPETGPELFAPLATILPDLDGTRFALAGLSLTAGHSYLHVVASGLPKLAERFGPGWRPGFSWWVQDGAGHWHLGAMAGRATRRPARPSSSSGWSRRSPLRRKRSRCWSARARPRSARWCRYGPLRRWRTLRIMDREGAETYLRLLAEAAMRGSLAPAAAARAPNASTIMVVGHALTAVGALDPVTAEEILADFRLAVTVRHLHGEPGQGAGQAVTAAQWLAQGRPSCAGSRARPRTGGRGTGGRDARGQRGGDRADRFVPVGMTVPFLAGAVSGELCLMSFAQTGTGARFIAAWQVHSPSLEPQLSYHYPGLIPFEEFTVTDDRGGRYKLDHTPGSDLAWPNMIRLSPAPPGNIRWLDVAPPYRQAVRVALSRGGPHSSDDEAQVSVSDAALSAGEHLLVMLAERLLTGTPEFPRRGMLAAPPTSPRQVVAGGFGDIIAALKAADVLSPLSPVPARLATLCASLDLTGHGIAAPPTLDLPEPWLSLLAHYQRRKPEPNQMREGYAALAATLPELDGIRVTLLGLQHTQGSSALHVLAQGRRRSRGPGRSTST